MAELQINKRYVNEAELGGDLFRQTNFYSDKALEAAFISGYSFDLGKIAFENRNSDLSGIGISMNDYQNYLSGEDQTVALQTAFGMDADKNYKERAGNIEYLKAQIEQAKNQEIYENQGWFVKTTSTIASTIANIGVELYGTIEGLIDAGATIINFFANSDDITNFIATDKTGYKAAKTALEDFNFKYTDIGHGGFGGFIGKSMYYLGGMAGALLPAMIPGGQGIAASRIGLQLGAKALTKATAKSGLKAASRIGRSSYWISMGGHVSSEAADYITKNDLDISGTQLGLYALAVTGVEFGTEMLGGKIFGGSVIDRMVLGKLASPATKWGSKLSTKSAFGAIAYRSLGDIVGEGVEEMISEWADGLLYSAMITGNPDDQASFSDIMYAGFLGGVFGGLMGGARLGTTRNLSVTKNGGIVQTNQLTEEQKKNAVQLTKAQSIILSDNLANIQKVMSKEQDYMAQARETNKISEENAKELTEKQNQKLIETAAGLGNFFANVGDEEFKKAFNLFTGSVEQQAQSIRNFANRSKPETKIYKELVEQYNKTHPHQSIDVVDEPSIEAKRIQEYIQNNFGVNVLVLKTGAQDGVSEVEDGITINEYTIGFREDALKSLGTKGVLNQIIAHELAHTLAFAGNILTPANLLQVKRVIDDMGIQTTKVGKSLKLNLNELSEAQADAIAELLLFDDAVVEKILFNERNIFKKAFNWMKDLAKYISDPERRKKKKNFEMYKALVRRIAAYRKIAARNIGNEEDLQQFYKDMNLTQTEMEELADTYLPTWRTANCSITKYNLNIETLNKMEAVNLLTSVRKDKNDEMFDFARAFDPEYYSIDFINEIAETIPNTPFKEAIQTFVFSNTGYIISNDGWVIDGKNVIDTLNENFVNDLIGGNLLTPEGRAKYPTLHQLLDENAQVLFIGADGSSATEVAVVFKDSVDDKSFDADYNYVTKTLTLTLPRTNVQNKAQRSGFEQQLKRCMAMAIADVHSFYGGLVPLVVQQSLNKMSDVNLNKVAKQVLTDEFLATQPSRQNIIDMMTYKITELTTTQRTLDDVTSGFITNGTSVQGYGDFFGINFAIAGVPTNEQVTKTLMAINKEYLDVAFKVREENPKYDPANTVAGQTKFELTDKEVKPQTKTVKKEEALDYTKKVNKNQREKRQLTKKEPVETTKKETTPKKQVVKTEPKEENAINAPNEKSAKILERLKKFEFSNEYISQTKNMNTIKDEDKTFSEATKKEFAMEFDKDIMQMTDEELLFYIEYRRHTADADLSVSARKAFDLLILYALRYKKMFKVETRKALEKAVAEKLNVTMSEASSLGELFAAAAPLRELERNMIQEGIDDFKIPEKLKERWVDAARNADLVTQTEQEQKAKQLARDALSKHPRKWNFLEKGLTPEERKKRWHTTWDRINGLRYLAMLSNPATHIRNIVGNVGITAMVRAAEGFSQLFNKFIEYDGKDLKYLPEQKVNKEDIDYVSKRFAPLINSITKAGKYDTRTRTDASHIMDNIRNEEMFGTKMFKWLQTLIYDKSLSKMDVKFSKPALEKALTQMLVANFPKEFEYDKQNYGNTLGVLFDTLRPFEDIIEDYDINYDKQMDDLTAKRDAAEKEGNAKEVAKISNELAQLSDVYLYIRNTVTDRNRGLDVKDVDALKNLLACKTKDDAIKYMRDYHKNHKETETVPLVTEKIKVAREALERNGIKDDDLSTVFTVATRRVLTNYLRYENKVFKQWCKLMDNSIVLKILSPMVIPFAKVVTNMTLMILQYSPLTLARGIKNFITYGKGKKDLPEIKMDYKNSWHNFIIKTLYGVDDARFLKAQIADDLGKGTTGTLLLIFGVILAALGILEKDDEDDKYGGYVLKPYILDSITGEDLRFKLSDIAPSVTPIITGAALFAGARNKGFAGALTNYWEQITNDTMYESFNTLFQAQGDTFGEKTLSMLQTYVTQYVPAALRSIQKVVGPKAAVDYSGNWFEVTWQKVLSALPVASRFLPTKIDPYTGNEELAYNSRWAALFNIILPTSVTAGKKDAIRNEAVALGAATNPASGIVTINDTKYNLKGKDKQQFQTDRARYINTLITDFTKNKTKVRVQQEDGSYKELTYSQMTNEEKQTAFKSYYSKATTYAKIKYWINSGHKYVTSSRDEYNTLKKLGINATYRVNTTGSKYKN